MKNLLIDSRIRACEFEYLSKYFKINKIPLSKDVYEQISGHSDIFYCKVNNDLICAPNAPIIKESFIVGELPVKEKYPQDVLYNAVQIGNLVIGSKFTDKTIKPNVIVKQGYCKCSVCVTSPKSCITTDYGIYDRLIKLGIDALYIDEDNIKLLDRNGNTTNMKGFIGGATLTFDDKFVLFGDIEQLKSKKQILNHLQKYKLKLIDFKELEVYDYGGGLIFP